MKKKTRLRCIPRWLWITAVMLLVAAAVQQIPESSVPPVPAGDPETVTVQVLDVGQAESILITTGDTAILIDGGEYPAGATIRDTLRRQGIEKLDAVILTHPHSDHYGGLRPVLEEFSAAAFYTVAVPEDQLPTVTSYARLVDTLLEKKIPSSYLAAGDTLAVGQGSLTVLSPAKDARYESINNYSLVMRLQFGASVMLLTGDAEWEVEQELLDSGASLSADVLKTAHHGSNSSSGKKFLSAVSPRAAVISVGLDNDYGLPKEKVISRLQKCGATVYRTDLQGCITVTMDGNAVSVTAEK